MRLIELLQLASEWNEDNTTIYLAQPWSCEADAILVTPAPTTTGQLVREGTNYSYFLETFLARDFLDDYARSTEGASASDRERCERLVRYAENDA